MQKTFTRKPKAMAFRLIRLQVLACVCMAVLAWPTMGQLSAQAVLIAGGVVIIANILFAVCLFRGGDLSPTDNLMMRFYTGEIFKLFVSAGLIAWAIAGLHVKAIPFLLAYFVLQMLIWPIGMMAASRSD